MSNNLRSHRISGIAIIDVVVAMLVTGFANKRFGTGNFRHGAMAAVPIGIAVHWLLGMIQH